MTEGPSLIKKTALLFMLALAFNAILYSIVWGHHMFVSGLNPFLSYLLLFFVLLITIPLVIRVTGRSSTWLKKRLRFTPEVWFAWGSFIFLTARLFDGLLWGNGSLDIQLHDTYFVLVFPHTLVWLLLALLFAVFFAFYHFYPKLTGRELNTVLGYIHFWLTLTGLYLIFWPVRYEGLAGMPRRYIDYSTWTNYTRFYGLNAFLFTVTLLTLAAQAVFVVNLLYSLLRKPAPR